MFFPIPFFCSAREDKLNLTHFLGLICFCLSFYIPNNRLFHSVPQKLKKYEQWNSIERTHGKLKMTHSEQNSVKHVQIHIFLCIEQNEIFAEMLLLLNERKNKFCSFQWISLPLYLFEQMNKDLISLSIQFFLLSLLFWYFTWPLFSVWNT